MSVSWNTQRITIKPTKEKKSQKLKILDMPSTKKAVAKVKRPTVNDLVDDFANIMGSIFQAKYKNRTLLYHYRLSLILYSFN